MRLVKIVLLVFLVIASSSARAEWVKYPSASKFVQYSYEVLSGNKKSQYFKIKLLSNYSKSQEVTIKNQSIAFLSRVDYETVNCSGKSKQVQITAFELFEDADAKGWSYKGSPKKIQWDKVAKKSTLDSLLTDICSGG